MATPIALQGQPQFVEVDSKLRGTPDLPTSERPVAVPRKTLRERLRRPLLIVLPCMMAAVGIAYYLAKEPYVTTDDAFVRAAKESVNARVAGQVIEIAVSDNQRVQRGQLRSHRFRMSRLGGDAARRLHLLTVTPLLLL